VGKGKKRRYPPGGRRPRGNNPPALGGVPTGLSEPTGGAIDEPGRTIWKYATGRWSMNRGDGPVVTTAQLVPLFWGDFWRTATDPAVGDVYQAIAQILASPYLSEVMQYGFESLTLDVPRIVIPPEPVPQSFSGDDAKDLVWDLIDGGLFPEPDDGGRNVYMVFAPKGSSYDDSGATGAHGDAEDYDFPFDVDHAWVGWCDYSTTGGIDGITETFTHELVEILTDPQPSDGWTLSAAGADGSEIADACFNQTGMISGIRVSAYYSDRLKACVVPSFRPQYSLAVGRVEEHVGPIRPLLAGRTATTKHSICFSGSYEWTRFGFVQRVTLTATASGYTDPQFTWTVNKHPYRSDHLPTVPIPEQTPAGAALDPLGMITDLPPQTVTGMVQAGGDTLILESVLGAASGEFDISCTVTEKDLPHLYHSARSNEEGVTISGSLRAMDERFQSDLDRCMHLKSVLARQLIEEVVIPRIDGGDPPEAWVERPLRRQETEAERQAHQARFLAHFVERADPDLAATLRVLAAGRLAVARGIELGASTDVKPHE
jgi:hypothetical protein